MNSATDLLKIHPLVIASASDHFTRVQVNCGNISGSSATIGLLFGSVHDNIIAVNDATDVLVDANNQISEREVDKKAKLWTAVYPTYQLIGWYAFDTAVTPHHYNLHQTLLKFCPSPVFLLFLPTQDDSLDRIPMRSYLLESVGSSQSAFIEKIFTVDSSDVEKLALDEITKSIPVPGSSKLEIHTNSLLTSLTLLENKIEKIAEIVDAMETGKIPKNNKLMQSAQKIVDSLTALQSAEFQNAFHEDLSESMLSIYLSSVVKSFNNLNEVSELAAMVGDNKGNKSLS